MCAKMGRVPNGARFRSRRDANFLMALLAETCASIEKIAHLSVLANDVNVNKAISCPHKSL